jgi:cytochrome c-type biogenesis protein CcmF
MYLTHMLPEIGQFALILALIVSVVQTVSGLYGGHTRQAHAMALAPTAAVVQAVAVLVAFAVLMISHGTSDFSVENVYQNSHRDMPLAFKLTAVWGSHEGSMLLWLMVLAQLGAAVAIFDRHLPATLRARVLGVQGLVGAGFLAFSVFTSNPFLRMDPVPADGRDLNPLLQDIGLVAHPPFLYLGFVGFSIAFSFAVAALLERRVDPVWARWVRPWTLVAWTSLTLGIALGAGWAYYELGWGGFWFWDPVENASLMPWLAGTALLHSAAVVEKRDTLKAWTILMAITAFSTSILGTFVVRSGLLTSVHAFATDPTRGLMLLALCVLFTGGALTLFAMRAQALRPGGAFQLVSRETALIVNNVLLVVVLATVMIGTFWPIIAEVVQGETVSVGPPYYTLTAIPLAVLIAVAMAPGVLTPWKRGDSQKISQRLAAPAGLALLAAGLAFWLTGQGKALASMGAAIAVWVFAGSVLDVAHRIKFGAVPMGDALRRAMTLPRAFWGGTLAHIGIAVIVIGMLGATVWKHESLAVLEPGQSMSIAGRTLTYDRLETGRIENYEAETGYFTMSKDGRTIATFTPQRRWYPVAEMATTEAAIRLTPLGDFYIVLGDPRDSGAEARVVRAYRHPWVSLLWGGCLVMVIGGLVSLSDRRYRLGVAAKRAPPAPETPAPSAGVAAE